MQFEYDYVTRASNAIRCQDRSIRCAKRAFARAGWAWPEPQVQIRFTAPNDKAAKALEELCVSIGEVVRACGVSLADLGVRMAGAEAAVNALRRAVEADPWHVRWRARINDWWGEWADHLIFGLLVGLNAICVIATVAAIVNWLAGAE